MDPAIGHPQPPQRTLQAQNPSPLGNITNLATGTCFNLPLHPKVAQSPTNILIKPTTSSIVNSENQDPLWLSADQCLKEERKLEQDQRSDYEPEESAKQESGEQSKEETKANALTKRQIKSQRRRLNKKRKRLENVLNITQQSLASLRREEEDVARMTTEQIWHDRDAKKYQPQRLKSANMENSRRQRTSWNKVGRIETGDGFGPDPVENKGIRERANRFLKEVNSEHGPKHEHETSRGAFEGVTKIQQESFANEMSLSKRVGRSDDEDEDVVTASTAKRRRVPTQELDDGNRDVAESDVHATQKDMQGPSITDDRGSRKPNIEPDALTESQYASPKVTFNRHSRFVTPAKMNMQKFHAATLDTVANSATPTSRPQFLTHGSSTSVKSPSQTQSSTPKPIFALRQAENAHASSAGTEMALLPEVFSPHRRGSKDRFLPNGWASQVRSWVIEAGSESSTGSHKVTRTSKPRPGSVIRILRADYSEPGRNSSGLAIVRAVEVGSTAEEDESTIALVGDGRKDPGTLSNPLEHVAKTGKGVMAGMIVKLGNLDWAISLTGEHGATDIGDSHEAQPGVAKERERMAVFAEWRIL